MSSSPDQNLEIIISRVDFYESCVEQLKKEIPKYLAKQHELDKSHKSIAKVMRAVASTEPNQKLQNTYFMYAQKQEIFERERLAYIQCEKQSHELIEEAKKLLIAPLREIIADHKILQKKPAGKSANDELNDTQFIQSTLPVHARLFERHRVHGMKKIMSTLLLSEIQYHARVVEELSQVLGSLSTVGDDDVVEIDGFNKTE